MNEFHSIILDYGRQSITFVGRGCVEVVRAKDSAAAKLVESVALGEWVGRHYGKALVIFKRKPQVKTEAA